MKAFEVRTPDGRLIRHLGVTIEALRASLAPNYAVTGEVFGGDVEGRGGYVVPLGGKSLLAVLLEAHGEELKTWLRANLPTLDVRKR
jgi:hypothetical protein